MGKETILEFTKKPSILSCYLKFLFIPRKGLRPGENLPSISGTWNNIKIDRKKLKNYSDACGLVDSEFLPPLYPHIIAAPVHTAMVSNRNFPLQMIGSIHQRNHILQRRPISINESIDISCIIDTKRNIKNGLEFDIITHVAASGEIAWESITTVFIRGKFGTPDEPSKLAEIPASTDAAFLTDWFVPAGTGRKYAKITGDYNPIHLSPVSAKLFGFKRDIAHGMWTLANAIGKLPLNMENQPLRIDVAFKGPMYMNNKAVLHVLVYESGNKLDVYCGDNPRPIICADVKLVSPEAQLH